MSNNHINSFEDEDDLNSSIFVSSSINLKCPLHQTLNKYYIKSENKFLCEYDGFDKDGPDSFLHMPQILEIYREEILNIQKNQHLIQKSKIEDLIPHFLSKLKKIDNYTSKLSQDIVDFKRNIIQKIIFLLKSNSNLYDIRDLINEVNFGPDGKPNLKKIGMNEQKEQNLIFLTQFLIFRESEKIDSKNLLESFTNFLEEIQKKLVEIIFNSIDFVDLGYTPFQDEIAKLEKKTQTNKLNMNYLKSHIVSRKDYDALILYYDELIKQKDFENNNTRLKYEDLLKRKDIDIDNTRLKYEDFLTKKDLEMDALRKKYEEFLKLKDLDMDSLRLKYEELLKNKDLEIKDLNDKLNIEKFRNQEFDNLNQDLHEKLMQLKLFTTEQETNLKKRITELEAMILAIRNENEDLRKNQNNKHFEELNKLKEFYEKQLAQMKDDYSNQLKNKITDYEKTIANLKLEIEHADNHKKNLNSFFNSSIDDLNNKRVKELELFISEERKKREEYVIETEKKMKELNLKFMELPKINEQLQKRILELETQIKDLKIENDLLKIENENFKKMLKDKEVIMLKLIEEDKDIRLKDKKLNEDLLLKNNELEKLNNRFKLEFGDNQDYRKYFDLYVDMKKQHERNVIDLENSKRMNEFLQKDLVNLKADCDKLIISLNNQTNEARLKHEELLTENTSLAKQLNENKNKLYQIQKTLDNLNLKLKDYPFVFGLTNQTITIASNNSTVGPNSNKSLNLNSFNNQSQQNPNSKELLIFDDQNHRIKSLENDLILEIRKNQEGEEKHLSLKKKIINLEEIIAKSQKGSLDFSGRPSLNGFQKNLEKQNNFEELLEKDLQAGLQETRKENEYLKQKIAILLDRIEEFNRLVLNFNQSERINLLRGEYSKKITPQDFKNIDFIENDVYSLLLLNRKNYIMLREWLLPLSRNSLGIELNPENKYNIKFNLLFKASLYGFSVSQFIAKCHNIPNTVVIASTNMGKLIGGFTPLSWTESDDGRPFYCIDDEEKSFLFSLSLNQKFPIKNKDFAILCSNSMGPVFGGGSDFEIVDECHHNPNKYADFGHSYYKPDDITNEDFYGDNYYNIVDYEVYEVLL